MLPEKTNISARVEITLKKIVEESSFTHKDAYELGAMLIAIGDAQETITLIHNNPNYERIMKQREYKLIEERKQELERELRDYIKGGKGNLTVTFGEPFKIAKDDDLEKANERLRNEVGKLIKKGNKTR